MKIRNRLKACSAGMVLGVLGSQAIALDLLQSYRLALQNDAMYQASVAGTDATRELVPQAIAQMLPTISGSGTRSKNHTDSVSTNFVGNPVNSSYDYFSSSYALTLRQPIFRMGNFAQYRSAKSQVASAEASLDKDRQDLAVRLSNAYFDALLAGEQLSLILAQKEAYSAQLKSAKRYLENGLGTRTDVDDAQARYDMTVAQEFEARKNVDLTRRALQVIVKEPISSLAGLSPGRMELTAPNPANPDEWVARGEDVNAELRALRANVETARSEVSRATAGHMPTIDLIAQRTRNANASDTSINQRYLTNQLGVQFNIPLFSGGYVSSTERQALASLERQQQLYENRRREVEALVRREYQNVSEGILKVRALEQAERSSEQAVFSNQKGFQAGTRTQIDILNAQQQLVNTKRDLAQARYQYLLARVRLQGLVGSLGEGELTTINNWLSEAAAPKLSAR